MLQVLYYNVFSVPDKIESKEVLPYLSKEYTPELFQKYRNFGMDTQNLVYDRTSTIPHYINIKPNLAPIPTTKSFSKSFEQVIEERCVELLSLDKVINVVWSGGIDSTLALFALLKFANDKSQIRVYGTYSSILESGDMFDRYILPLGIEYKISVTKTKEFEETDQIYVTGFMGNQLFGPTDDFSKNSSVTLFHHQFNYEDPLAHYSKCITDEKLEFLKPMIEASPKKIETVRDLRWWFIFNLDWYTAKFDALVTTNNRDNVYHFFDTEDFQRYAITTTKPFTKEVGNPLTHRWEMRQLIEEYSGNAHYSWNKTKGVSNLSNSNPSWMFLLEDYSLVTSKPNHNIKEDLRLVG
jgi:hypothetical protein